MGFTAQPTLVVAASGVTRTGCYIATTAHPTRVSTTAEGARRQGRGSIRSSSWPHGRPVGAGLVNRRGRQRTDSTHVLAAVYKLSGVKLVAETMRATLRALAAVDEVWLAGVAAADWGERHGRAAHHERQPSGAGPGTVRPTSGRPLA
jgi:hypothetical protein